jgi:hypothetical protein
MIIWNGMDLLVLGFFGLCIVVVGIEMLGAYVCDQFSKFWRKLTKKKT